MASTKKSIGINFADYLKINSVAEGESITHTRIGCKEKGIMGGSYHIESAQWSDFTKRYYQSVFVDGKIEYLTEKQLIENGPILIDIDLRYEKSILKRQHTASHIVDAVMLYAEKIDELVELENGKTVDVFVMEKGDVNVEEEKTKDGIHIIIGIKMHKALQVILRKKVIEQLKHIWDDLPITNTWEDVLDEGITRGHVGWQVYGSRKPGNQAYLIKYHYVLTRQDDNWEIEEKSLSTFSTEKYLEKLSARYMDYEEYPVKEKYQKEFEEHKKNLNKKESKSAGTNADKNTASANSASGGGAALKSSTTSVCVSGLGFLDITSEEILDSMLNELFTDTSSSNYLIKETHEYALCLPETYYGPGSYSKWIRVGWALANTNSKMFLTWIKFSSRDICRDSLKGNTGKFDWKSSVKVMYEMWKNFGFNNPDKLTNRSIMYWAKNDSPKEYKRIQEETTGCFIEQSIKTVTEYDMAHALHSMYKDNFVFASGKSNTWYEFKNNRWFEVPDISLRTHISKELHQAYSLKLAELNLKLPTLDSKGQEHDTMKKDILKVLEITVLLKKTVSKDHIMREARELFYDREFIVKLDENPYLLCFNNCVVDFKNKIHRQGQPDDYISKCTNIDYTPFNEKIMMKEHKEITSFIKELFPVSELHDYMWEHLASTLIGTNKNQTFNIYYGGGRNGKSKLTELMSKSLGEYKATVPITLITQKRNTIGSTSSEIVQLKGVRYAVMQEPSKGDRINEGIMKEITGGDPIQGRALFKDTITFTPQFKLVVCTNELFEDMSTDDGTWRRIRICDFMSKFLDKPYEDEKFPRGEYPFQYKLDKDVDKKFDAWAPVFTSYLVKIAYELQGDVKDCRMVLSSSDKYRNNQDYLADFAKDKLKVKEGEKIKKTVLLEEFRVWYIANHGRNNIPKGKEVHEYMDKKYGAYKNGGWKNVLLFREGEEEEEDEGGTE